MSANDASNKSRQNTAAREESFGQLIGNVRSALLNRLEREFAKQGSELNFTQYLVMKKLSTEVPMTATELARSISHDAGAMTRLLDRLTEKGYLRRLPHAQDRRALQIEITEAGRDVWLRMNKSATTVMEVALHGIGTADREKLTSVLKQIQATLQQENDSPRYYLTPPCI